MHRPNLLILGGLLACGVLCRVALAADPAPADPDLVGWWKFDDASGTKAADASGHQHHGLLEGELTFEKHAVPGRVGKALALDGKNQSIRIEGFKGVAGTRPRTIALWIKTATPGGQIVSWGSDEAGKMWMLSFIRARIGVSPKGGYYYMKEPVHDDAWHHVAVVVSAGDPPNLHDSVTLYRDGEEATVADIGLLDLWPIDTGAQLDVQIGRRFKGALDELRIYSRALSEEQIKALFKETSAPAPAKP